MWPTIGTAEELKDYMKESYDNIFFFGNKVLKLDQEKDTTWFNAYRELASAINDFIVSRLDSITQWTGS